MNFRRHRKALTSLILGAWLFALFAGIASACLTEPADAGQMAGMSMALGHDGHETKSAACQHYCDGDTPLLSQLKLVQDQPAGQPLLVAVFNDFPPLAPASVVPVGYLAHPPPDVPILLRTQRLAL
jgi:hypothetical protein